MLGTTVVPRWPQNLGDAKVGNYNFSPQLQYSYAELVLVWNRKLGPQHLVDLCWHKKPNSAPCESLRIFQLVSDGIEWVPELLTETVFCETLSCSQRVGGLLVLQICLLFELVTFAWIHSKQKTTIIEFLPETISLEATDKSSEELCSCFMTMFRS